MELPDVIGASPYTPYSIYLRGNFGFRVSIVSNSQRVAEDMRRADCKQYRIHLGFRL